MDIRQVAQELRLEHWAKVLRERKDSGLSIRRWCRDSGVCEKTHYYWQRKLRERMCGSAPAEAGRALAPATFAQLRLPSRTDSGGKLLVRIGGAEIEIHGDMPAATIEAVIQALIGR